MLGERTLKRAVRWVLDRESIRRESLERELEAIMGFRGQFRRHRDFEFQLLKRMELRPDHHVLDVGCGPLTLGMPLIEFLEPGGYVGVDVRPLALAAAYREVCDHGLVAKNPRLLCSTTFGSDELGDRRFDRVCAFSMLFHLHDSLLRNFFGLLSQRLRPGGFFLANVNVDMDPSTWEEFPFVQRPLSFYEPPEWCAPVGIHNGSRAGSHSHLEHS